MKKLFSLLVCLGLCLGMLCGCKEQGGDQLSKCRAGKLPRPGRTRLRSPAGFPQCADRRLLLDAQRGTFSWLCGTKSGMEEGVGVCAESLHPLQMEGQLPQLNGEGEVSLSWDGTAPDKISARCWPDTEWGNTDAESQQIPLEGDGFALREGGWIYEISAEWDSSEAWGGQAVYFFYGIG